MSPSRQPNTNAKATEAAKTALLDRADKVRAAWKNRLASDKKTIPYFTADGILKRHVYLLVKDCIDDGTKGLLEEVVRETERHVRPSQANAVNPFYWGILLVCGFDERVSGVSKGKRVIFSQELFYAHMHKVPECFLIGFIHQIGPSRNLQAKINSGKMQTWYDKWNAQVEDGGSQD